MSQVLINSYSGSCWRKQLLIAKDARRVDVLSFRINMSYRLLDGTSRFKELHDIVTDIKLKLDTELGPLTDVSTKMARGIVSRLSVAGDVQNLCSTAIEKADEWLAATSGANRNCRGRRIRVSFIYFKRYCFCITTLIHYNDPSPHPLYFFSHSLFHQRVHCQQLARFCLKIYHFLQL